jgi:hypothetical protein
MTFDFCQIVVASGLNSIDNCHCLGGQAKINGGLIRIVPGFVDPGPPTPSGDGAYETFFYGRNKMNIVVIGPVNGFHLLGYYAEGSGTFYLIHKFCNKTMAELTASRMNQNRQQGNA